MEWWQIALGAIVGLIALMILIIIHEIGHAWAARRNGVKVEEFGIGFPPRAKILGKYKGILVTLNWLPLGGFCKMKGDDDFASLKGKELKDRKKKSRDGNSFDSASFWVKTKILFAGVFMNFLAACVIMTILAWVGLPKVFPNQFAIESDNRGQEGVVAIAGVIEGSPAEEIGLQEEDEILSLSRADDVESDATTITEAYQVSRFTRQHAGQATAVEISRDGEITTYFVVLNDEESAQEFGFLGVQTRQAQSPTIRATWSAPIIGVANTSQFIWHTITGIGGIFGDLFGGLWGLIAGTSGAGDRISAVGDSVAGPVGIIGVIFPAALAAGAIEFLFLTAVISLTLTVMNILPIPGLDGGRWYLIALFKLFRKKLTKEIEESVVGVGMLVLFALIILITVSDVMKLW